VNIDQFPDESLKVGVVSLVLGVEDKPLVARFGSNEKPPEMSQLSKKKHVVSSTSDDNVSSNQVQNIAS
jgi:hypothetical protein